MHRALDEGRVSQPRRSAATAASAPGRAAALLALQRVVGNRGFTTLMRSEAKTNPATAATRRALRELEAGRDGLVETADDFLRNLSGDQAPREVPRPSATSQRPPRRGKTLTPRGSRRDRVAQRARVLGELDRIAGDIPTTPDEVAARDIANQIREAGGAVREAEQQLERAGRGTNPSWQNAEFMDKADEQAAKGSKPTKSAPDATKKPDAKAVPAPDASKSATPATKPTAKPAPAPTAGKVATEVASEAVEEVARPRKLAGLGAKVGKATLALIDGLMPDPTDAIALLISFAESFNAAQEAVRKRNLENGFAVGWACYVLFPTWERARTFARTYVEKDVITQIIDAVGIAENAYNEGLVRGFRYGEKHSTAQLDRVRQSALDAVHRSGRTVNGDYLGDGVYQFVRNDVFLFAGALLKATREVLAHSERRREAREERERFEREARKAREDFDAGNAPAGVREW